jgi:hypothetical protein
MTNFNPEGGFKDIETWGLIAQSKASNTGMSAKIIAGVLAGGAGVAFGMEILGTVIAAWCLKSAWDAAKDIGKRLQLVRDCGCNAFVLNEDDFRTYVKQFGGQSVIEELKFVQEASVEISPFAENWLKTCSKALLAEKQPLVLPRSQQNSDTPNVNIGSTLIPPTSTQVEKWDERDQSFDIEVIVRDRTPNLFIVGLGRSGKGMLLANLLRSMQRLRREKKVFLVNGKDDPKEYGYFDGVVAIEKRLDCDAASASTVAEFIEAALEHYDAFASEHCGALLVVDEATIIGAKLKTAKAANLLNDRVVGITSSGDSSGKNIWICAQSPYAGANGSDLTALSQLTKIALIHKTNLGVISDWKQARIFKNFDIEKIAELIDQSEVQRAIYYGGTTEWYAMNKLVNYSAFNRDNNKFIADVSVENKLNGMSLQSIKPPMKLSANAEKILSWLESKKSNSWFYYKNSGENKRDNSFTMMLSRLGLLVNEFELNEVFTELLEAETIEISEDNLGIRLL